MAQRPIRIFLAGIMQGSHRSAVIHDQEYRRRLSEQLREAIPGALVYDPLADHTNSLEYDDERGKAVFFCHNQMCSEVDVVIAFVPEASMGTAIEMWEAYRHGRIVLTISPLIHNWTVKYCSHALFPDLTTFERQLTSGHVFALIAERLDRDSGASAAHERTQHHDS